MSKPIITVRNLGKSYRIGLKAEKYPTFRDALVGAVKAPLRRIQKLREHGNGADTFWALKDVSFEVQRGEVVGIIGRNGAGKSTLLKILSRITEPTEGEARLRGRVASLLEVGTGFHPELTGRENIYLNGAILGMKKAEIDRKFDEIVAFSEVEKFLDTPVKRYSSGMYVRLAFAVAAHLEPEILIVDEVLAVGDAQFQKKCLGKMQEVAKGEGRTVLFVSHNMAAIQSLCHRVILLEKGLIAFVGDNCEGVALYLTSGRPQGTQLGMGLYELTNRTNPYAPNVIMIKKLSIQNSRGNNTDTIGMGEGLFIRIRIDGIDGCPKAQVAVIIKGRNDQWLANFNTGMKPPTSGAKTTNDFLLHVPRLPFVPGSYWIDLSVAQKSVGRLDYVEHAALLHVADNDVYGSGYAPGHGDGIVFLDGEWR